MSRSIDKKILELLKEKVLEKDKELNRKEYHKATKEALAEMTSLSNSEVEKLYAEVKKNVETGQKRKRTIIIAAGVIISVILLIIIPKIIELNRPPEVFTENFDDNSNTWSFANEVGEGFYLTDGQLLMNIQKEENSIEYIDHRINFPENFSVEVDAVRESGMTESYGFYIGKDGNNFGYFFIRPNGKFRYGFCVKNKWQENPEWEFHEAVKTKEFEKNKLRVNVSGNHFQFFVNGQKVGEGHMYKIDLKQYSLAVGGTQKIRYDNLLVIDTDTKDTLFANTFDKEIEPWLEKQNIIKQAEFKNGYYNVTVNKDDYCYWPLNWIPKEFTKIKTYEITLAAKVLKRKGDGVFGLILSEDENTYFAFAVKNEREAYIQVARNSDFKYHGSHITESSAAESGICEIKIRKTEEFMEYYFNGHLADKLKKDEWIYWGDLERIGLRVCNNQTVAFDKLEFREIK